MSIQKISPFLWFQNDAPAAAKFYASVFPDSRVDKVTALSTDTPSGPAGSIHVVQFTLLGQPFLALDGAPPDTTFSHAISLFVECETQAELDRYWDGLLAGGGKPDACGWLRDRFGVSWQICPAHLMRFQQDPDRAKAARVMQQMMTMTKLDIAPLQAAYDGK